VTFRPPGCCRVSGRLGGRHGSVRWAAAWRLVISVVLPGDVVARARRVHEPFARDAELAAGRDDGRPGGALEQASAPSSRCLRQIGQASGANRSMSAFHACCSPFRARVTRSKTDRSPRIWSTLTCADVLPPVIAVMLTPRGPRPEVIPLIPQDSTIKLSFIELIKTVGTERQRSRPGRAHVRPMAQHQISAANSSEPRQVTGPAPVFRPARAARPATCSRAAAGDAGQ
jgi:hypothetical protein